MHDPLIDYRFATLKAEFSFPKYLAKLNPKGDLFVISEKERTFRVILVFLKPALKWLAGGLPWLQ